MITGYIFSVVIVSLIFNLINTLSVNNFKVSYQTVLIVFAVFIGVLILFKLPFIRKPFERAIENLARKIMRKNAKDNIITLLDVYDKDVMVEVSLNIVPENLKDKKLSEINSRDVYHINFLILKRKGTVETVNAETSFEKDDTVVVFGPLQAIKKVFLVNEKSSKEE